ncbi:MAG: helix-turn-helix transcriptional regulator [Peptostreptococcaceae bacterium]|nr:helix-turn-helix transcriptional regulator [Peptostreptococcaceae bacterium]
MSLGTNMKILRKRNRLSQIELASMVGVTERTIYNYEKDLKVPKASVLDAIADILGVTPELLMYGDPEVDFLSTKELDAMRRNTKQSHTFISQAKSQYGNQGLLEATDLLEQTTALFAGGQLSEEAKDDFFESITQAYFLAKRKSKLKNLK